MASKTVASHFHEQSSYFPSLLDCSSHHAEEHEDEETLFSRSDSSMHFRRSPDGLDKVDRELLRCPVMRTPGGTPIKMTRMDRRQEYLWEESSLKQGRRKSMPQTMADGLPIPSSSISRAHTAHLQPVAEQNDSRSTSSRGPMRTSPDSISRSRSTTLSLPSNNELQDISDTSSKSSQARRVVRGLPEMRILGPQIKAERRPRNARTRSEPFETITAVVEEKARRNLSTRPKPVSIVSSPQLWQLRPRRKLRSSASARTRFAEGSGSAPTSPMEPHIPGAYPQMFDHPYTPMPPETSPQTGTMAVDDGDIGILNQQVTCKHIPKDEPPRSAAKPTGIVRPNLLKSISRDFLRFVGVTVKQDNGEATQLPAGSPRPSTPFDPFPSTPTDDEIAGQKKKQRLRRWLSRISLNPGGDEDTSLVRKPSPTDEVSRNAATFVPTTSTLRKKQSTPEFPGLQRVATPPMNSKSGKLHGFFFDFKPPESEEERPDRSPTSPTSPYGESTVYTPGSVIRPAARGAERDWFRVRMDEIMAGHADEDMANFKWDVPEHLPGSPLCPLSPKHKSGGKGICIYHGRRKTQAERQW